MSGAYVRKSRVFLLICNDSIQHIVIYSANGYALSHSYVILKTIIFLLQVDFPQPFRHEQSEVGIRQNSQTLPSETGIYDNDPWIRAQEESGVYSNLRLEENKQGIVYASLNHSIIEMNPRQARNVKEAPTEYAAICVRS